MLHYYFYFLFFIFYFLFFASDWSFAVSSISHNLFIYFILIFNFHYWILSTFHYLQQGESLGLSVALLFLLFIYLLFYLLFIIFYFYRIEVLQYHIYLIIYLFIYYFLLLQDCNAAVSYISRNLFIYLILISDFHYCILSTNKLHYWILSYFHYLADIKKVKYN